MENNIKQNAYICITESLSCTVEVQHCKSTILKFEKLKNNNENILKHACCLYI